MKPLVNDAPLLIYPQLALAIGLEEAVLLQQLHFRLHHQGVTRDGEVWYCQSYERWQKQFPFWGVQKVKKRFLHLEKLGLVISNNRFNRYLGDRTKWYRINYKMVDAYFFAHSGQNLPSNSTAETMPALQEEPSQQVQTERSYLREVKDIQKNITNKTDAIYMVIDYLNEKALTNFNKNLKANQRHIASRLNDGFTIEDCFMVIDEQVRSWKHDLLMQKYLRPSTLFKEENFESYYNNALARKRYNMPPPPLVLDFSEGETGPSDWD